MCTLTAAAASTLIGTSAIDTYLDVRNSGLARDEARYSARRARAEAALADLKGSEALARGERDATDRLLAAARDEGAARNFFASGMIDPDVGTPAALGAEIRSRGAYDAGLIRHRAEVEAYLARFEAGADLSSAGFAQRRAANIRDASVLDFAGDVLRLGGSGLSAAGR